MNIVQKISHCCCIGLLSLQVGKLRATDQDILIIRMDSTEDVWSFTFHRTGSIRVYYGASPLSNAMSIPGLIDVDKLWADMMPYLHSTDDTTPPARLRVSARAVSDPPEMQVPWWYVNDPEPFKEFICQLLCVVRTYDPEHFKSLLSDHPILGMHGLSDLLSSRADPADRIEWPIPPISDGASDRPRATSSRPGVPEPDLGPARREAMASAQQAMRNDSIMPPFRVLIAASLAAICLAIYCFGNRFKTPSSP